MSVDIGESLVQSWLKHIKKCQIIQTNWKISPEWDVQQGKVPDNVMNQGGVIKEVIDEVNRAFSNDFTLFNSKPSQVMKQLEIDAIGISFQKNNQNKYYVVESAFHTSKAGLQYKGGSEGTAKKVIQKFVKNSLCLYSFFNVTEAELYLITPKIIKSYREKIDPALNQLQQFMNSYHYENNKTFNYIYRIISDDDFDREVLTPVKDKALTINDTSELFLRSCTFIL